MKPSFETLPPAHSIGARPDALWTVVSNHTFNPFHRNSAGSITGPTANTNLLLGGTPAFRETTRPWMRAPYMTYPNSNPASENEAELNIEETLVLIERVKSAALEKLNKTRLALKSQCDNLDRLRIEDDYVEGIRFMLKQELMNGIPLATIASMFTDIAKRNAARATLLENGEITEKPEGTSKILKYIAQNT